MYSQALGSLQALPALTNVTCLSGLNSSSADLTLFFTTFKNQFCSVTPLSVSCLMLLIYCPRLYCLFGTSFSDVWFQETERENYKHLFLVDFNCCCSSFWLSMKCRSFQSTTLMSSFFHANLLGALRRLATSPYWTPRSDITTLLNTCVSLFVMRYSLGTWFLLPSMEILWAHIPYSQRTEI